MRRSSFAIAMMLGLALVFPARGQATRESALEVLRAAAQGGRVDAQLALAQLLDTGDDQRNQEALALYEKAARAGNRVAQRRYLEMMTRPERAAAPPSASASEPAASPRSFFMRVPRDFDPDEAPPDLPPGYHCHVMGGGRMWCHGGLD